MPISFSILTTDRLTLRQLSINDCYDILALRSDLEVNKYLNRQPTKTEEEAIDFINKINDNFKKNMSLYWAIILNDTKTFVGTICLFDFSNENNSCEMGYELLPKFQGQGIMSEAVHRVIDYVFDDLKMKIIMACPHYDNQDSIKLLTKLNFEKSPETHEESPDLLIYTLSH